MAYVRKTRDEYQVHGFYHDGQGGGQWEEMTCADTRAEAYELLLDYRRNEAGPFKMVKKRLPADEHIWSGQ